MMHAPFSSVAAGEPHDLDAGMECESRRNMESKMGSVKWAGEPRRTRGGEPEREKEDSGRAKRGGRHVASCRWNRLRIHACQTRHGRGTFGAYGEDRSITTSRAEKGERTGKMEENLTAPASKGRSCCVEKEDMGTAQGPEEQPVDCDGALG